jgi:hypothetical protein
MWDWIFRHVDFLNFVVLTSTLIAVVAYTRAAFQQAEGHLKPCLVPDFHADQIGEREMRTVDQATTLYEMGDPMLIIRNIGSGPALNIRYRLTPTRIPKKMQLEDSLPGSPIEAGSFLRTGLPQKEVPNGALFHAEYASLSGKKYRSVGVIVERKTVPALSFARAWWLSNLRFARARRKRRKKFPSFEG